MDPDRGGILGRLAAFSRCQAGNVVILFALTAIVLFGLAGVAIDYGRALTLSAQLQSGLAER